jgi:hypothetical protein
MRNVAESLGDVKNKEDEEKFKYKILEKQAKRS